MRVAVLGAGGMLGQAVMDERVHFEEMYAVPFTHAQLDITNTSSIREHLVGKFDALINCAGVCHQAKSVNSLGPRYLAYHFKNKILHVSTDCVFSGSRPAPYVYGVRDAPDSIEEYGVSKMLGERPEDHVCNVRTSFIGYKHGLLRWFIDYPSERPMPGWTNAMWSGSSVYAVARGLWGLLRIGPWRNIQHLATDIPISKYELLQMLNSRYSRNLNIFPVASPVVNRGLMPTRFLHPIAFELDELYKRQPVGVGTRA